MIEACEHSNTSDPSSFLEALDFEYRTIRNKMKRYILRHHLSKYPRDLLRHWWDHDGCMPSVSCQIAFNCYKRGEKPGHLYQGPGHFPKLRVIDGGKAVV